MLSEDRKSEGLAVNMTIAENLAMPKLGRRGLVSQKGLAERTRRWATDVGLRYREPFQAIKELSGGNQQKVAIARLLDAGADVLLLDEPTRGIDVGSKAEVYRLIDQVVVRGKAVLMTSSYLPELFGMCDRIAVMKRGRLGAARPVAEWTAESIVAEASE
jgi:ribose transport system ATP-binding protein